MTEGVGEGERREERAFIVGREERKSIMGRSNEQQQVPIEKIVFIKLDPFCLLILHEKSDLTPCQISLY